jgi:hypothetical protein
MGPTKALGLLLLACFICTGATHASFGGLGQAGSRANKGCLGMAPGTSAIFPLKSQSRFHGESLHQACFAPSPVLLLRGHSTGSISHRPTGVCAPSLFPGHCLGGRKDFVSGRSGMGDDILLVGDSRDDDSLGGELYGTGTGEHEFV